MITINNSEQKSFWNKAAEDKTFTHPINLNLLQKYFTKDNNILDIGCGYGRVMTELNRAGYKSLTGCDFSRKMQQRGQQLNPQVQMVNAEIQQLPFFEQSFDAILLFAIINCLTNFEQINQLASELFRILKPNGIIYLSDYLIQTDKRNQLRYDKFQSKYQRFGTFENDEGIIFQHFTRNEINDLFARFKTRAFMPTEVRTMNGNTAAAFQTILQKPAEKS